MLWSSSRPGRCLNGKVMYLGDLFHLLIGCLFTRLTSSLLMFALLCHSAAENPGRPHPSLPDVRGSCLLAPASGEPQCFPVNPLQASPNQPGAASHPPHPHGERHPMGFHHPNIYPIDGKQEQGPSWPQRWWRWTPLSWVLGLPIS